jgi:hemerythrin-like domain-containing protein
MSTKTTAHLSREHRQATHLLGAFRRYLRHIEEDNVPDSREPSGLIDFLEESLFQRHEEKEEGLLLPELARSICSVSTRLICEGSRTQIPSGLCSVDKPAA